MDTEIKEISTIEFIDLILVYIIAIIEYILLGYYFFTKMSITGTGNWGYAIISLLISGFIIFIVFVVMTIRKIATKEWIFINKDRSLGYDKNKKINFWIFVENLIFFFTFGYVLLLLSSIKLLPILINTFHGPPVFLTLLVLTTVGMLYLEMRIFRDPRFLNNEQYRYLLNLMILFYFYFIEKFSGFTVLLILLAIFTILDMFFSSINTNRSKWWDLTLISLIVLLVGLILLIGMYSMDYNQKEITLLGSDANIVCSPKNNYNLILENSLIDCNITDTNLVPAKDTIIFIITKDSDDYNIAVTDFDENRIIFNVPKDSYRLKVTDINKEYKSNNLDLMTIEDYNKDRQEFGKYFFLLLGTIFLTIPWIIKAYSDIKKELQ